MAGARRRIEREQEAALATAHAMAAFSRAKRLKPLSEYLKPAPTKAQTPDDMLALLKSLGAPMTIKKLN